ncbi:MAG: SRPBCC family protein [Thermoleophilaceae bacterium]
MNARLGTIKEAGDKHELRYERRFDHSVERVWAAITEPDELRGWLAAAEELDLREGGAIQLRWLNVPDDTEEWQDKGIEIPDDHDMSAPVRGTITQLDPPNLIEYETDEMGLMRWELRGEGSGCALTFTNTIELPGGHLPEQTLAGWHIHLDHLDVVLAGGEIDWSNWTDKYMDQWEGIRSQYVAAL